MNSFSPKQLKEGIQDDMNALLLDLSNSHFVMEHLQAQSDQREAHVFTQVAPPKPAADPKVQQAMDQTYGKKTVLTEAERRELLNAQLAFSFIFSGSPEETSSPNYVVGFNYHLPPAAQKRRSNRPKSAAMLEKELSNQRLQRFERLNPQQKIDFSELNLREQGKDKPIESMAEFDDGLYFAFALAMLETAAQDIEKSKSDMELYQDNPTGTKYKNAKKTFEITQHWLDGGDAPFTLEDCAVLLEQELKLQSLEQVHMPDVVGRYKELGQWIRNDPSSAKHLIRSYNSLFNMTNEQFDVLSQSHGEDDLYWEVSHLEDDDEESSYAPRRMRLR